jgi:hypothetical protein
MFQPSKGHPQGVRLILSIARSTKWVKRRKIRLCEQHVVSMKCISCTSWGWPFEGWNMSECYSANDVVLIIYGYTHWSLKNSGVCYNERCHNERMLQRTVFINKIRMLQRTRRNTIGQHSTRARMTCWAFPLWLEHQSSSLLSFVRFSYQFSPVICLFVQCIKS